MRLRTYLYCPPSSVTVVGELGGLVGVGESSDSGQRFPEAQIVVILWYAVITDQFCEKRNHERKRFLSQTLGIIRPVVSFYWFIFHTVLGIYSHSVIFITIEGIAKPVFLQKHSRRF